MYSYVIAQHNGAPYLHTSRPTHTASINYKFSEKAQSAPASEAAKRRLGSNHGPSQSTLPLPSRSPGTQCIPLTAGKRTLPPRNAKRSCVLGNITGARDQHPDTSCLRNSRLPAYVSRCHLSCGCFWAYPAGTPSSANCLRACLRKTRRSSAVAQERNATCRETSARATTCRPVCVSLGVYWPATSSTHSRTIHIFIYLFHSRLERKGGDSERLAIA